MAPIAQCYTNGRIEPIVRRGANGRIALSPGEVGMGADGPIPRAAARPVMAPIPQLAK